MKGIKIIKSVLTFPTFCFFPCHCHLLLSLVLLGIFIVVVPNQLLTLKKRTQNTTQIILFSSLQCPAQLGLRSQQHSDNVSGIKRIMLFNIHPVGCEMGLLCY